MHDPQLPALTQPQRDRLAFIELRLRFLGNLGRQDLVNRFGIQVAAATRDIAQYKELAAGNVDYDSKAKIYIRTERFRPIFDFPPDRVLLWLSQGFGDGEPVRWRPPVASEGSSLPAGLDLENISRLTRAIHQRSAVEVSYHSLTSGLTTREIVPIALADAGQSWHLRAFDRRGREFRDFALGRLRNVRLIDGRASDQESAEQDIQWNRITELELVPHPANVQHPDAIEAEYGMENGVLKALIRAAMAGCFLRRWRVDCTEDHSLKGAEYHLWLRNPAALYGITHLDGID